MITDEKAEKYVRKLKKYCRERECDECILYNVEENYCSLMSLLESPRFSDET